MTTEKTEQEEEGKGGGEFQTAQEFQNTGEARRDHDIQQARIWLKKQPIKKSGYNKRYNYHYFEFDDIIGAIQEACQKYDLTTHFTIESIDPQPHNRPADQRNEPTNMPTFNGMGLLEVKSLHYHIPRRIRVPLVYMMIHQEIGKAVNYCKRYAYMLAFEISEVDLVDITPPQNKNTKTRQTTTTKTVQTQTKQNKTETHTKQEQSEDNKWKEEKIIKSLHNKMREKNPQAYTDKKTTLTYAKLQHNNGKLSNKTYEQIKKIIGQV